MSAKIRRFAHRHSMQIAVNTRFLLAHQLEGFGHYTNEILSRMVSAHPDDRFDFYFDRRFDSAYLYSHNVRGRTLFPPARHPVLFYLWYQVSLRRALMKRPPDVFFSPDGFTPIGLEIPSVITIHDVAHRPFPHGIPPVQQRYYDHFMPRFIREARRIITVSEFSKAEIQKYYEVDASRIDVIYNGVGPEYTPLSEAARAEVREKYAQGAPYFLFIGAIHPRKNVAGLIRAYTAFRNRGGADLKLVIVGRRSWDFADVDEAVAQSPFRKDIVFTGYVPMQDLAQITASAFALCYISLYEGFGLPVAEAMQCGVPVIVTADSAQAEVAGSAGLVVNAMEPESAADAMTRLVNDSSLYTELKASGLARSTLFSWDTAAAATYRALVSATQ